METVAQRLGPGAIILAVVIAGLLLSLKAGRRGFLATGPRAVSWLVAEVSRSSGMESRL